MINRRSLLRGLGALTLSPWLASCGRSSAPSLRVELLENSIPVQLVGEFQRRLKQQFSQTPTLTFLPKSQLLDLYTQLQDWQRPTSSPAPWQSLPLVGKPPSATADLITLGDYWLTPAIQQQLIQPLDTSLLEQWSALPMEWQRLVQRNRQGNPDPQGQVWAAPYRWGSLAIAYRVEEFQTLGWTPTDWADLWRPDLKGRVSLPDSARAVIGLTLKKLGQSVNVEDIDQIPDLQQELAALQNQVKFYSSDAYLQPLMLKDTWLAVGWSTDLLPLLRRNRQLAAVIPASGTMLTADMWVRPSVNGSAAESVDAELGTSETGASPTSPLPDLAQDWIDFCWQDDIAVQLSVLGVGASPILTRLTDPDLLKPLQNNPVLLPSNQLLQKSEFLSPLSAIATERYRRLWEALRTG